MYTGYFAKLKKYQEAGLVPVSIALKSPDWYNGLEYKQLAPNWDILSAWKSGEHQGDVDYYTQEFNNKILKNRSITTVIHDLMELTNTEPNNIILLCYEKPEDFCHRHLVADWITKHSVFLSTCIVGNVVEFGSENPIVLTDEAIQKLKDLGYDC